jgi:hypothetical protein
MNRPGRCPDCGKVWLVMKKHPEQKDVILYRCPKGHSFKKLIITPPSPTEATT